MSDAPSRPSPILLGVRHHGPGSARAVRRALEAYQPEIVLIEGPPEADPLVQLAGSASMQPPVALLAYRPPGTVAGETASRNASFLPFAEFSPEWQAVRWAVAHEVPARFIDLPAAYRFARESGEHREHQGHREHPEPGEAEPAEGEESGEPDQLERTDPIGVLARAAGYDDPERWWEDLVEHRLPVPDGELAAALAPFDAIGAAMAEVRSSVPARSGPEEIEERQREAHMRTALRAATKQHAKVAVVCGAWHVPALTAPLPTASADATILKGLAKASPKVKIAMTWVPWSHGRLASWQGYGAGVTSPGWYHHLFTSTDRPITRWLVAVASLLRGEGLLVSSAHVIEATRLAQTLGVLRGRPLAGLAEVSDATLAVLCDGEPMRMHLVNRRMVVGERLGGVPDETPSVPLVADVTDTQRRLRMKVSALDEELRLDLRQDNALERSRLLHRLRLLGVHWGTPAEGVRRGQGTFWEDWRVAWQPEFAVDLIVASGYGTRVIEAATAKAKERCVDATLPQLTQLVHECLLADLPAALPAVLSALADRVALDADAAHLMQAVPPLARTLRYGDVRGTELGAVRSVAHGLVVRVCLALPGAVTALDDDAAATMREHLSALDQAITLLAEEDLTAQWHQTLARLVARADVHGLVAGRLTRLLLDAGKMDPVAVGDAMSLVLTIGVPPARSAAWVEGFLAGGGLLLVHDDRLLSLVDRWLTGIATDTFVEVLPLLRRTFGQFSGPERRSIGEKVRRQTSAGSRGDRVDDGSDLDIDLARAELVLPTIAMVLGRSVEVTP